MQGSIVLSTEDVFKHQIIIDYNSNKLSRTKAALILKLSKRSISRLAKKVSESGIKGIAHGNKGRTPYNKIQCKQLDTAIKIIGSKLTDFNLLHAWEILRDEHQFSFSYSTLRREAFKTKILAPKKRRPPKPKYLRERVSQEGLLLQMDGSFDRFNGKDQWCLIAAIDDATSDIPYGEFFPAETTEACLKVLHRIIEKKGTPNVVYTDRAGWAGGTKRTDFAQFKQACESLGINVVFANSPQAKGRIERAWKTIKGRLSPELRRKKINTMSKATEYFNNVFLESYWRKRNTVVPTDPRVAYRQIPKNIDLGEILTPSTERKAGPGNRVCINNGWYVVRHPHGHSLKGKLIQIKLKNNKPSAFYFGQTKLSSEVILTPRQRMALWDRGIQPAWDGKKLIKKKGTHHESWLP